MIQELNLLRHLTGITFFSSKRRIETHEMGYLGAHIELVAETELERGILDFTPIHIPQDQTSLHILGIYYLNKKLMSKFRQG